MNKLLLLGVNSVLGIRRPDLQCDFTTLFNCLNSQHLFANVAHLKSHLITPRHTEHQPLLTKINVQTKAAVEQQIPFIVVTGDHSSAIGTWGGVMEATCTQRLGLIWLDAHMDAHDFNTTPSGNLHGMPVAALLGVGDAHLSRFASLTTLIQATDLVLMGVRSYEIAEREKLEALGVTVIYQQEIETRARFAARLNSVHARLAATCSHVGMSIDLDVLSPEQVVAVATPEANGIPLAHLIFAINRLPARALDGIEIAEYYSSLDPELQTQQVIITLIKHLLVKLRH